MEISGSELAQGATHMKHSLFVSLILAITASACTTSADTSTQTTTTAPSVTLTTETVTGTVPVGGSDIHNVVLSQTGELDVTLTAAGPPSTIFMGLGIGTLSGSTCVFLSAIGIAIGTPSGTGCNGGTVTSTAAGTDPQVTGTYSPGRYCVNVSDVGSLAAPAAFIVTIAHP